MVRTAINIIAFVTCALGLATIWSLCRDDEQYMSTAWAAKKFGHIDRRWQAVKSYQQEGIGS